MKNEYNIDLFWKSREETVVQRSFQKIQGKVESVRADRANRPSGLLITVSHQILRFNLIPPFFKSVFSVLTSKTVREQCTSHSKNHLGFSLSLSTFLSCSKGFGELQGKIQEGSSTLIKKVWSSKLFISLSSSTSTEQIFRSVDSAQHTDSTKFLPSLNSIFEFYL